MLSEPQLHPTAAWGAAPLSPCSPRRPHHLSFAGVRFTRGAVWPSGESQPPPNFTVLEEGPSTPRPPGARQAIERSELGRSKESLGPEI